MHILYRFGSFGIVLVGLVKGPTDFSVVVGICIMPPTEYLLFESFLLVFSLNSSSILTEIS